MVTPSYVGLKGKDVAIRRSSTKDEMHVVIKSRVLQLAKKDILESQCNLPKDMPLVLSIVFQSLAPESCFALSIGMQIRFCALGQVRTHRDAEKKVSIY